MSKISEIEIKSMTKEQNYMRGYKDGKSDVLDKIRAEIEALPRELPTDARNMIRRTRVLEIIDKYKAESEPQESEEQA